MANAGRAKASDSKANTRILVFIFIMAFPLVRMYSMEDHTEERFLFVECSIHPEAEGFDDGNGLRLAPIPNRERAPRPALIPLPLALPGARRVAHNCLPLAIVGSPAFAAPCCHW